LLGVVVNWSVNFENKRRLVAEKVDDKSSKRGLPAKAPTSELVAAQEFP
jgi:hypothetical protein